MEQLQLCFVEVRPENRVQRTQELVSATVRAHNAKVAHAKRSVAAEQSVKRQSHTNKPLLGRFRVAASGKLRENVEASKHPHSVDGEEGRTRDHGQQSLYILLYRQWMDAIRSPISPRTPQHIAICR